jgi:hypothetical protein
MFSTVAALVLFLGFVLLLLNVVLSLMAGDRAGDNPWGAGTLEWATSSPPPPYNFAYIPLVTHAEPVWQTPDTLPVLGGLATHRRELLLTTVTDARPDLREPSPRPSIWPFVSAVLVAIAFIVSIFTPWAVTWGGVLVGAALIFWFWPKNVPEDDE